jgi:hypothetical protein
MFTSTNPPLLDFRGQLIYDTTIGNDDARGAPILECSYGSKGAAYSLSLIWQSFQLLYRPETCSSTALDQIYGVALR